jgi:hypothetical protein
MSRITNAIRIIDSRVHFFPRLISRVHSASGGQNPRLEKSILLVHGDIGIKRGKHGLTDQRGQNVACPLRLLGP